jgi:hypothetical protein
MIPNLIKPALEREATEGLSPEHWLMTESRLSVAVRDHFWPLPGYLQFVYTRDTSPSPSFPSREEYDFSAPVPGYAFPTEVINRVNFSTVPIEGAVAWSRNTTLGLSDFPAVIGSVETFFTVSGAEESYVQQCIAYAIPQLNIGGVSPQKPGFWRLQTIADGEHSANNIGSLYMSDEGLLFFNNSLTALPGGFGTWIIPP